MTGAKYRHAILALLSICLLWFSLLDHGQCGVSFSSVFHRTTRVAVAFIVNDTSPHDQINATSTPSYRLLNGALNESFSHWLYRFITPSLSKERIIGLQPTNRPVVRLISILHKKNGCHQSSQDDPHLNPLSFI